MDHQMQSTTQHVRTMIQYLSNSTVRTLPSKMADFRWNAISDVTCKASILKGVDVEVIKVIQLASEVHN